MEEQLDSVPVPRPRRRRKTKTEIIKEAYLPYIFLMIATLFVIIFIIGALVRNGSEKKTDTAETDSAPIVSYYDETIL